MRALSACPLLDAGNQCLLISMCQLKGTPVCLFQANVQHSLLSFSSIMYFYGLGMAFCFYPQHIVIINSSLILLCWLHVRPYLPLNTLSPINIFQISDTICRIQMKLCQELPALCCLILGANCILLNLFCNTPYFYRNKHVRSARWVNSIKASGFRKLMCHDNQLSNARGRNFTP